MGTAARKENFTKMKNTENKVADIRLNTNLDSLMQWRMEVLEHVFGVMDPQLYIDLEEENRQFYREALEHGTDPLTATHVSYLAHVAGDEAGCGDLCFYREMPSPDNHTGECAYLMNIYVREAFRHHGVATEIVETLLDVCRHRKITKVYLETTDEGRPVYERLGFHTMTGYLKLSN